MAHHERGAESYHDARSVVDPGGLITDLIDENTRAVREVKKSATTETPLTIEHLLAIDPTYDELVVDLKDALADAIDSVNALRIAARNIRAHREAFVREHHHVLALTSNQLCVDDFVNKGETT